MTLSLIRTFILFCTVIISLRLMGKRQIGQLQPYELVIIIMLSELAAIPMQNVSIPLLSGFIPILILLISAIALSYLSLKSERFRQILCGTPSILIEKGKIVESEMARQRYNINDLLEQLRINNVPDISDVEFAILETSGNISIIPKSNRRPVVTDDLDIKVNYEGMPLTLIIDGFLFKNNLERIKLTEEWLLGELTKHDLYDIREVLFAGLDVEGRLFLQAKSKKKS